MNVWHCFWQRITSKPSPKARNHWGIPGGVDCDMVTDHVHTQWEGGIMPVGPIRRALFAYKVRLTHGDDLEFTVQDDMAIYLHYQSWLNGQEAVTTIHAKNALYFREGGTDTLVDFRQIVMMQVHEVMTPSSATSRAGASPCSSQTGTR